MRGELLAAIHAIRHRIAHKRTLICSDSKLVIMGATGKASKWQRHDWQGSRGPVGHVDLWEQLLQEIEQAGAAVRWMHVPSHVGIVGNTHADTVANMGRRKSPLLRGYVTTARHPQMEGQAQEQEEESDLDEPPMFSPEEWVADPPPRSPPPPHCETDREPHRYWRLKIAPWRPRGHVIPHIALSHPQDGDHERSPAHHGRHPCVAFDRNSSPP